MSIESKRQRLRLRWNSLIVPFYAIIFRLNPGIRIFPTGMGIPIRQKKDLNMGKIKSALELAMEKTADLKTDKSAVKKKEISREGKVSLSLYLENPGKSEITDKIKFYKGEELDWFRSGALETILANLTLPRLKADLEKLVPLEGALSLVSGKKKDSSAMFDQIRQLFSQYLSNLDQLEESLKQQYEPQLRQKEMQLKQQTGQDIRLSPEQDPEFMDLLAKQLSRMDQQYNGVLKQAKEQIRQSIL